MFAVEDRAEEYRLDAGEVPESQELLAWLSNHDGRDVPGFSEVAPVELETEALEKLRQLGYLE